MKTVEPSRWMRQAKVDFRAAQEKSAGTLECHRRYWYQQSYEKALKAYAISRVEAGDDAVGQALQEELLRTHSPLSSCKRDRAGWLELEIKLRKRFPESWGHVLKELMLIRRDVVRLVNGLDHKATLEKVDATTPSISPNVVSYRYPFFLEGKKGTPIAPAEFTGWDDYQGDERSVKHALEELLEAAGRDIGRAVRSGRPLVRYDRQ